MTEETAMSSVRKTFGNGASNVDKLVFRIAGLFVLISLALSQLHSIHWLWFTAFIGANMLQASFTGFCPLAMILGKLGVKPGAAFCPTQRSG